MKINRRTLFKSLAALPAFSFSIPKRTFAAEGNSLTSPRQWVEIMAAQPWFQAEDWTARNFAIGGSNIGDLEKRAPMVDLALVPGGNNWLSVWEMTNSLQRSMPVTEVFERHMAYCKARRAAGWKVIFATMITRDQTVKYGPQNFVYADMVQINNMVRARWTEFADVLVDHAADPRLGWVGAPYNPEIYRDGVHLTGAGNILIWRNVEAALRARNIIYYAPIIGGRP